MMAGDTIDLDEIATPEILDPRQVKGLHSGLCSCNVLGALAVFVNGSRHELHRTGQRLTERQSGSERAA
jgi:hypothetical protein